MKKSSLSIFYLLVTLLTFSVAKAQVSTPVLGWRSHFSYKEVKQLALGQEVIFAATENTIFAAGRTVGTLERFNKITGLSDVGIGAIQTLPDLTTLVVGYKNGNIDIVSENSIRNISTVKEYQTTQSKAYRSIVVDGANIYLAGDLGIVVYNLDRNEITEAYQNLGQSGAALAINDLLIYNDSIFAATDDGIMAASLSADVNRQDFNNWSRKLTGLSFDQIIQTGSNLYASSENDLFQRENDTWVFVENFPASITSLVDQNGTLLLSTEERIMSLSNRIWETNYTLNPKGERINDIIDDGSYIWIGTGNFWLVRNPKGTTDNEFYVIDGTGRDTSYHAVNFGRKLYSVPSSFSDLNTENHINVLDLENGFWEILETKTPTEAVGQVIDLLALNGETFYASYEKGLFKINSSLVSESLTGSGSGPTNPSASYNLSALELDEEGLIWATFYDRPNNLYSYNPTSNQWQNQSPNHPFGKYPIDLFIGPNGDKWLTIAPEEGGGILVYNETSGDERYLNLNGGQGGLPSNEVTDIELDEDLFVWVATSQGIAFFTNPFGILQGGSLTASVPIYENRLLLRNEYITDIAIDPANRKWFGTRSNGTWLFSETGEELIYHFTIDNSPLPSNHILSMAIEPKSGELLITTDKGAISFRSDATEGTDRHENVKVYPNPVAPDFNGQIVIEGLVNNAQLKVTDVSGKLVKEIRANGSTAIWNGRDLNNSRVKSGVYLVFSSSQDGLETYVAKIVVI